MKESQAWRILAEEHDAVRTSSPYLCDLLRCCEAEHPSPRVAAIPPELRDEMVRRITADIGTRFSAYPDIDGVNVKPSPSQEIEGRESRVLACLMFAEIARDEERAR